MCRGPKRIDSKRREKLAVFCNIDPKNAISAPDVRSIYQVPLNFERENFGNKILGRLGMKPRASKLEPWRELCEKIEKKKAEVKIGIVGKYFSSGEFVLSDAYISVIEAVKHASWKLNLSPVIEWLNAEDYEKGGENFDSLLKYDGIIVPGGFGNRGIEGKIKVAGFCRKNNIPYFGLCYGMQIATIEFAREVLGLRGAHTEEIDPKTSNPVIHTMIDQVKQISNKNYGGTMRLGGYRCRLFDGTISKKAYKKEEIVERHRHRYEFNNKYKNKIGRASCRERV